jgi:hypothetical protein
VRSVRKQIVLMTCPLVLCSFLALKGRTFSDSYVIPSGSPADDARVLAYSGFMREGRLLFAVRVKHLDRDRILHLARAWDLGVQSGRLGPLVPVSLDDSPQDGQRGDILHLKAKLVSYLVDDATARAAIDVEGAVREVLVALRLSESLKYSSLATVSSANIEEAKEIGLIQSWRDRMDLQTRAEAHDQLNSVAAATSKLDDVIRRTHSQYCSWKARMGQPITLMEVRDAAVVTRQMEAGMTNRQTMRLLGPLPDTEQSLSKVLIETNMAWKSQDLAWAPPTPEARAKWHQAAAIALQQT